MFNTITEIPFVLRNVKSIERASLILQAKNRILIYAPGLSAPEIAAVQDARQKIPPENILVYLDVSTDSFRAGYWHGQSPEALKNLIGRLSVHNTTLVRLGLLIVDDLTLIFTPPIPRIEAEPDRAEANALQLNADMTELLWASIFVRSVENGAGISALPGADGPEPAELIQIPERPLVDQQVLEEVSRQQRHFPTISPDQERLVTSLRNQLKLVTLHVEGYKFQNRTLSLPDEIVSILGSDSQQINEYLSALPGEFSRNGLIKICKFYKASSTSR